MNKSKGFTIIELLVVIAIIAVLAAIVLVNVTGYINKGKNAAVKGNMSTMLVNSAVYFDTYPAKFGVDFIGDATYTVPDAAAKKANGNTDLVKFGASSTTATQAWCSCSVIYAITGESGTFCVDSTGYKAVTAFACSTRCVSATAAWCVTGSAP